MTVGSTALVRLCDAGALAPGEMRRCDVDGHAPIALYNIAGDYHATADTCTHAQASLSEGDLEGDEVVCPVHFGVFHVPTGRACGAPLSRDLEVYPVVVRDGAVWVELP